MISRERSTGWQGRGTHMRAFVSMKLFFQIGDSCAGISLIADQAHVAIFSQIFNNRMGHHFLVPVPGYRRQRKFVMPDLANVGEVRAVVLRVIAVASTGSLQLTQQQI